MRLLSALTDSVPDGWDDTGNRIAVLRQADMDPARQWWLLWLESEWACRAGRFALAHRALDAAEDLSADGDRDLVLAIELRGARGRLLQDSAEPGRAYPLIEWAAQGWENACQALAHPDTPGDNQLAGQVIDGAASMVRALVRPEYLEDLQDRIGSGPGAEVAVALWIYDRLAIQAIEMMARRVHLEGEAMSFSSARKLANNLLAASATWGFWDQADFEVRLRQGLTNAAWGEQKFAAALGQADSGLAVSARLAEGRQLAEGKLRSARARALFGLHRGAEAADEYERARTCFLAVGAESEAISMALPTLRARDDAGEPLVASEVRRVVDDLDAMSRRSGSDRGRLQADLEYGRRLLLSVMADEGVAAFTEVAGIIELLHENEPPNRVAVEHPDPVVQKLAGPFSVLRSRLQRSPGAVVVCLEPRLFGTRDRPPVMVLLAASDASGEPGLSWSVESIGPAWEALSELTRVARAERQRLTTGEIPFRSSPSAALLDAGSRAWEALPESARAALAAADVVYYMPSAAESADRVPLELVRIGAGGGGGGADGGGGGEWLGAAKLVTRIPSLGYLEDILSPIRRRTVVGDGRTGVGDGRAVVAHGPRELALGALEALDEEVALAVRAATILGLEVETTEIHDTESALAAFGPGALVHYIGHGLAGRIGEALPVSETEAVSASALIGDEGAAAPFAFFNACELGRLRHVPGGSGGLQRGWALTLLNLGSPGVIGALEPVPDGACVLFATAFYRAALTAPIGAALRQARARLDADGVHPAVWATYVLIGDPGARLHHAKSESESSPGGRAAPAEPWDDTRDLAGGHGLPAATLDEAALADTVDSLLDNDPEAAGRARLLLALTRLERDRSCTAELDIAHFVAVSLQDGYAILHVLSRYFDQLASAHPEMVGALKEQGRYWLRALADDTDGLAGIDRDLFCVDASRR